MIQKLYDKLPDSVAYAIWRVQAQMIWLLYPSARRRYRQYCVNVTAKGRKTFPFHHWLYEVTRFDADRN